MSETRCPGCGLVLPAVAGPTHAYVASSPECWALFSRTLHEVDHRLLTDAYMAQHPDGDDRRQLQSVAVHLVTLRAVLVEGLPIESASRITSAAVALGKATEPFPKLQRPATWAWTIRDVRDGDVAAGTYAVSVLDAWVLSEGTRIAKWTSATLSNLFAS